MSDPKSGPNSGEPVDQGGKSAPPAAADQQAKLDQLPKSKQLTFVEQFAIWVLIIIVGALFGMSGSLQVLQGGAHEHGGIADAEVLTFMAVDRKLEHDTGRQYLLRDYESRDRDETRPYRERIKIARQAEADGLMPTGQALDKLVDDFLDEPAGPGKTIRQALNDYKGSDNEVTRADLRRKVAMQEAYVAFIRRHLVVPAVPLAVGEGLTMLRDDKVQIDEAVIDATTLLKPVPEDDPEIQQAYEKLRAQRFTKPESETLTVAYADTEALKKAVEVKEDDIKAYYEAHKADPDFQKPVAAPVPPAPAPPAPPAAEAKTIDEMKPIIVERLQSEAALRKAKELLAAFDNEEAEGLEGQKDNASFKAAAAKRGLAVKEAVIEPPAQQPNGQRQIAVPGLGTMRDQAGLFAHDKEPGFISRALPIDGPPATWAVLRLDARAEAGFKPLSEVKPQVMTYLQGQRTYKRFVAEAQAAREAAQKVGLAAYLASPEAQALWGANAKPTPATLNPSQTLASPPPELGQPSPDSRVAASMAMPEHPVALVEDADPSGDLPRAKLVQARAYEPGKAVDDVAKRGDAAEYYRRELQRYRFELFRPELGRIQEQK